MTFKELLIQELDNVTEPLIVEVLDFLHFLKAKQEQDNEDLQDARAALATVATEGTVAWDELKDDVFLENPDSEHGSFISELLLEIA